MIRRLSEVAEETTEYPGTILCRGDSFDILEELSGETFTDAVITDPPYNYSDGFLQQEWDDIGDEKEYEQWCREWATYCYDVLAEDGVIVAFSSNHTHHRLAKGIEQAGFTIQETFTWVYGGGLPKSPRLRTWLDDDELVDQWGDWRGTLKPAAEFAVIATKQTDTNRLGAVPQTVTTGTGEVSTPILLDPGITSSDAFAPQKQEQEITHTGTTRFLYESKASKQEKTHGNKVDNPHSTVKPIEVMKSLIEIVTDEGETVLDPFCGTATTGLAARESNRESVCIDFDSEYYETAKNRLEAHEKEVVEKTLTDFTQDNERRNVESVTDTRRGIQESRTDNDMPAGTTVFDTENKDSIPGVIGTPVPQVEYCTGREYEQWCREWADDALDLLLPGGHLVAFGGEQTHHRLNTALEDAGFVIRDVVTYLFREPDSTEVHGIGTEYAVMARKPLNGSSVANQVEHHVGNLNVEACRIPTDAPIGDAQEGEISGVDVAPGLGGDDGRYPANVVCDPITALILDAQSGISKSTGGRAYQNTNDMYSGGWAEEDGVQADPGYGDEGGASRYYLTVPSPEAYTETLIEGDVLTKKSAQLYDWIERLITPQELSAHRPFE